jgi:hypothetical protein
LSRLDKRDEMKKKDDCNRHGRVLDGPGAVKGIRGGVGGDSFLLYWSACQIER